MVRERMQFYCWAGKKWAGKKWAGKKWAGKNIGTQRCVTVTQRCVTVRNAHDISLQHFRSPPILHQKVRPCYLTPP
jgi:hypothetical protein